MSVIVTSIFWSRVLPLTLRLHQEYSRLNSELGGVSVKERAFLLNRGRLFFLPPNIEEVKNVNADDGRRNYDGFPIQGAHGNGA
jgi:hypothetical protein